MTPFAFADSAANFRALDRGCWRGAGLGSWRCRLAAPGQPTPNRRSRSPPLITTFTHRSHAHVILENFLEPYLFNGQVTQTDMQVASMFVDQIDQRTCRATLRPEVRHPNLSDDCRGAVPGGRPAGGRRGAVDRRARPAIRPTPRARSSIRASSSSTRSWPCSAKAGTACRCSTTSTCRIAGTGPRRWTTRPHELKIPVDGRQLGAAGPAAPAAGTAGRGPRSLRPCRFTAAAWKATTSMPGSAAIAGRGPRRGRDGRAQRAVSRRRAAVAGGRRRAVVDRAGRRGHGGRSRRRTTSWRESFASSGTANRPASRSDGILVRVPRRADGRGAEGRHQRHALELCLPAGRARGKPRATAYYVGPLAESQPVQGPVARDSNALPPEQVALSRGADAADQRHARRGHGLARWRRQSAARRRSST